jgi:hypothetical protein
MRKYRKLQSIIALESAAAVSMGTLPNQIPVEIEAIMRVVGVERPDS